MIRALILSFIVMGCASAMAFHQSLDKPAVKIDKYENTQANTIEVKTPFGKPILLNKEDLAKLEGKQIFHIDLVYTAYKESEEFDQKELNENRIQELIKRLPQIEVDQADWTVFEQVGAIDRKTAKGYFHGFVIHYGHPINYHSQLELKSENGKPFSSIGIINEEGGKVRYFTGSTITMPQYSVAHQDGEQVNGEYTLYYREFRNSAEIALSGIPMDFLGHGKREIFNSVGMFEIRAFKDGEELELTKEATIDFQCTEALPDVSFFEMDEKGVWSEKQKIQFPEEDPDGMKFPNTSATNSKFFANLQNYSANDWNRLVVAVTPHIPMEFIDQKGYQGYSRIVKSQEVDPNKFFVAMDPNSWAKFDTLYNFTDAEIQTIVSDVNTYRRTVKIDKSDKYNFLKKVIGQDTTEMEITEENGARVYKNGFPDLPEEGLKEVKVEVEFVGLGNAYVSGLRIANFGVKNCDQTSSIQSPVAFRPTYYDRNTSEKIENLATASIINNDKKSAMSYGPNQLVCNARAANQILLFTEDDRIFWIDEQELRKVPLNENFVDLNMIEITDKVNCSMDLAEILNG